MKNLRSFKVHANIYSKTYYISAGTFKDMSYISFKCSLLSQNSELHHSKQQFLVCSIDAWGNHQDVKYIKGLVNAKKHALSLYETHNNKKAA